jgi:type II secretion system protein I
MSCKTQKITRHKAATAGAFTFIEVMIALAIVAISLLALIKLHITSITTAQKAEAISQAVLLAEGKIAETIAPGYPALATDSGVAERNGITMNWRTEVTSMPFSTPGNTGIDGLRIVSVDIAWPSGIGRRNLKMSTCVADRKLR